MAWMSSPSAKACLQRADVGDMGEQAQFDLAVIGRDQLAAGRGDEGAADLAALLVAHGNVLQIGVGGGQPPGRRRGQRVGGVDAVGARIDEARQRVGIGRLELGELAPVEDAGGQFVALFGEVLEHPRRGRPGAGRGLLGPRQAHLAEQDVAELLGRAEVERRADDLLHLGLDPRHPLRELARQARKHFAVDRDAAPLHARERHDERALQRLVDRRHALGGQARLQARATAAASRRRPRRRIASPCRSPRARSR